VGLTVDMTLLDALVARLNAHFAMQKKNFSESLVLMLDAVLDPRGVTLDLVEHLNCLAPYGMGASQPRLAILDCKIARVIHIGEDHLKISIASGSCIRSKILFDAMLFRAFESDLGAFFLSKKNKSVYLVGSISVNIWKGRKSVQFLVEDAA
jgi:single-stranded-DNA-specific exonuclease